MSDSHSTGDRPLHGNTKHGHCLNQSPTKTYMVWQMMVQSCENSKNKRYPRIGGRGIRVCERWRSFDSFLEDLGEKPDGMCLGRIDNEKDFYFENCRWVTKTEICRGRTDNTMITIDGVSKTLPQWCEETGVSQGLVRDRLEAGWPENRELFVRRNVKMLTANGVTKTVAQWCRDLGIAPHIVRTRKRQGWSDEQALFAPVQVQGWRRPYIKE